MHTTVLIGIIPKEKQKTLTVRDVKQRAGHRKDRPRDKSRKDSEDEPDSYFDLSTEQVYKF